LGFWAKGLEQALLAASAGDAVLTYVQQQDGDTQQHDLCVQDTRGGGVKEAARGWMFGV
jgi:hypothetical protein